MKKLMKKLLILLLISSSQNVFSQSLQDSSGYIFSVNLFTGVKTQLSIPQIGYVGKVLSTNGVRYSWLDTATMLTPYLRKVDTTAMLSPYLRSNIAAATYLPLMGGTLTGNLTIQKNGLKALSIGSKTTGSYLERFYIDSNGNALFGTNTNLLTATPINISFGGTTGNNAAGNNGNLKWSMYNNGTPTQSYGIGMSSALMEFQAGIDGGYAFFTNALPTFQITNASSVNLDMASVTSGQNKLNIGMGGVAHSTPGIDFFGTTSLTTGRYNSGRIYSTFDGTTFPSARMTFAYPTNNNTFTDLMTLVNGSVGIGTTAPISNLNINQTATGMKGLTITGYGYSGSSPYDATAGVGIFMNYNTSGNRQLFLGSTDAIGSSTLGIVRMTGSTGYAQFDAATGTGSRITTVLGTETSNVGIGNLLGSPNASDYTAKFNVFGNNGSNIPLVKLKQYASTNIGNYLEAVNSSNTIMARVDSTGGGYFAGNVGIGTTSPNAKLHVLSTATTGMGILDSTSTLTTGSVDAIKSTSTVVDGGSGLNISMSGANSTASKTVTGQTISVTNTGTTSTNVGLNIAVSGATNNTAISATSTISGSANGNLFTTTVTPSTSVNAIGTNFLTQISTSAGATGTVIAQQATLNQLSTANLPNLVGLYSNTNIQGASGTTGFLRGVSVGGSIAGTSAITTLTGYLFTGMFQAGTGTVGTQYGYYYDQQYMTPSTGYAFYSQVNPSGGTLASATAISIMPGGSNGVGIGTTSPDSLLTVNTSLHVKTNSKLDGTLAVTGATTIGGTLGVTGTTTVGTLNGSIIGSNIAQFRFINTATNNFTVQENLTSNGFASFYQGLLTPRDSITGNAIASSSPIHGNGTWFTGGSTTTTKPYLLIEPTGTTSTAWSTLGTGIGVNAATGFTGKLADFQVNGASVVSIDNGGSGARVFIGGTIISNTITANGNVIVASGANSFSWGGSGFMRAPGDGVFKFTNNAETGFDRLQFGGTTSSFPALKRSTTSLKIRLADDSGDGSLTTGGFSTGYVAKTANYTATTTDHTIEATSGTFTITLPTAVGATGQEYVITNSGTGVVTLGTTSSQTFINVIATPTTLTLAQFATVMVQSNGTGWLRITSL